MYHPTSRVLAVLELLQAHKRMTGAELARRLEVNIRTLRRYITTLQDIGIPIEAERGRAGAYELGQGFRLPPMMFTNEEALALELGLMAAAGLGLTETAAGVASARAKLEHVLPLDLQGRVQALGETIRLSLDAVPTPPSTQILMLMSSAAGTRRRVRMAYQSRADEVTEREFDPYGLAFRRGKGYVVGWCHLRGDVRSFRLDRISTAHLTDIPFARPDDFDALRHVEQGIATLERVYSFEVLLHTDLETAQKEIKAVFGLLEPTAEGVRFIGSSEELDWVARVLAGLPFGFVIHHPAELRTVLHAHAARLVRMVDEML